MGLNSAMSQNSSTAESSTPKYSPPSSTTASPWRVPSSSAAVSRSAVARLRNSTRSALNLPPAARGGKAVVANTSTGLGTGLGEQAVGIAVDQVHDVVYLREDELQPAPAALRELCGVSIAGTAPYAGRTMTVLNLPVLLAREEWIVNEHV